MKNSAKILTALAAGIAAGSALGILFAPDKGKATRNKISDSGKKLIKTINNKFSKEGIVIAKEKLEKKLQKVNTKLHEFTGNESPVS